MRRNEDGTVTPLLTAGMDFQTFGVNGNGDITVANTDDYATISIYGH